LVLPEVDLPVGCLAEVKLLGIMEAEQRRPNKKPKRNDRVIARIVASRIFPGLDHVGQLGSTVVDELGVFFHTYKASRGQSYDVLNVGGPDRAVQLIQEGMQAFQDREAAR
jgi:inorganic pyrophosphatase